MTGPRRAAAALPSGPPGELGRRLVVVSPHCDDAVLSLGATLRAHVRAGGRAVVLTVFAGDPASRAPGGPWDRASGFRTRGEAAAARHAEDERACRLLGVQAVRLDEADEQDAGSRSEPALWSRLRAHLDDGDELLLPGFPLEQADHRAVTRLVLGGLDPHRRVRLYVEQPYGLRVREPSSLAATVSRSVTWGSRPLTRRDALGKARAVACYRSQLPLLGPGRLPASSRLGAAAVQAQLLVDVRRHGERITAPVRAGDVAAAVRQGAAGASPA